MTTRARDIRADLRGKIDPILLRVLEGFAEDVRMIQHEVVETVKIVRQLVELLEHHNKIFGELKKQAEELESDRNRGEPN